LPVVRLYEAFVEVILVVFIVSLADIDVIWVVLLSVANEVGIGVP
jgi:hypothetical protein